MRDSNKQVVTVPVTKDPMSTTSSIKSRQTTRVCRRNRSTKLLLVTRLIHRSPHDKEAFQSDFLIDIYGHYPERIQRAKLKSLAFATALITKNWKDVGGPEMTADIELGVIIVKSLCPTVLCFDSRKMLL